MNRRHGLALVALLASSLACETDSKPSGIEFPEALVSAQTSGFVSNLRGTLQILSGSDVVFTSEPVTPTGTSLEFSFSGVPTGTYAFLVQITGDAGTATGVPLLELRQSNVALSAGDANHIETDASTTWTQPQDNDLDHDRLSNLSEVLGGLDPANPWSILVTATAGDPIRGLSGTDGRLITFVTKNGMHRFFNQRWMEETVKDSMVSVNLGAVGDIPPQCQGGTCPALEYFTVSTHGPQMWVGASSSIFVGRFFPLDNLVPGAPIAAGDVWLTPDGTFGNRYTGSWKMLVGGLSSTTMLAGLIDPTTSTNGTTGALYWGDVVATTGLLSLPNIGTAPWDHQAYGVSLATCGGGATDGIAYASMGSVYMLHHCPANGSAFDDLVANVATGESTGLAPFVSQSGDCSLMASTRTAAGAQRLVTKLIHTLDGDCATPAGPNGALPDADLDLPQGIGAITTIHVGLATAYGPTAIYLGDDTGAIWARGPIDELPNMSGAWRKLPDLPDAGPIIAIATDDTWLGQAGIIPPLFVATAKHVYRTP